MKYPELMTLIADTLNRKDLTANIPSWIEMAESVMNREIHARMEFGILQLNAVNGMIGLPCDFAGVSSITALGQPNQKIVYASPDKFDEYWMVANGPAPFYTIVGGSMVFAPSNNFDLLLRYWKRLPSLSKTCPSNWILERNLDAYLYGALVHSAPFLKDDSRIGIWSNLFESAVTAINQQSVFEQAGAHVEIRSMSVV